MTKITVDALSADSLSKAADRVRKLQRVYVNRNRMFVKKLCEAGFRVIQENASNGAGDSEPPEISMPHVMVGYKDGLMTATLRLQGEDVMFVEFGAGITYNGPAGQSPNPLGAKLGYTIGSYGQGHGAQEYWFYDDEEGTHLSFGTEATMPMYKAGREVRQKYASIARSVFGNITGV